MDSPYSDAPIIVSTPSVGGGEGLATGYRMIRLLGRGTMASVYLAEQLSMSRLVALKILSPRLDSNPKFVERFMAEAKAAARLNHPNIVGAIEFGVVDDRHFLAMEYVAGETLAKRLERGHLDKSAVVDIGRQIALALEHAARHQVLHRDVKPANIMIGGDGIAKLTDFGLALLTDAPGMGEKFRCAGTPYYVSPEQMEGGALDWRSDQFSLGVSLYEAATGQRPFQGRTIADILASRLIQDAIPADKIRPELGHDLAMVLKRMMARRPSGRFQSFADLERDFNLLAKGQRPYAGRKTGTTAVQLAGSPSTRRRARAKQLTESFKGHAGGMSGVWTANALICGVVVFWALVFLDSWLDGRGANQSGPKPASESAAPGGGAAEPYRRMRDLWLRAYDAAVAEEQKGDRPGMLAAAERLEALAEDGLPVDCVYVKAAKSYAALLRGDSASTADREKNRGE